MTIAAQLDAAAKAAGLNITGVRLDVELDKATWKIQFAKPPSAQELITAQSVITAFDLAAAQTADAAPNKVDKLISALVAKGIITAADALALQPQ